MIRSLPTVVVSKVLLDDSRTKRNRSECGRMTWCMVGQTKNYGWEHGAVSLENIKMDVVKVTRAGGIVCVALHENQPRFYFDNFLDGALHFPEVRSARRQQHRLLFRSDFDNHLWPSDIS